MDSLLSTQPDRGSQVEPLHRFSQKKSSQSDWLVAYKFFLIVKIMKREARRRHELESPPSADAAMLRASRPDWLSLAELPAAERDFLQERPSIVNGDPEQFR